VKFDYEDAGLKCRSAVESATTSRTNEKVHDAFSEKERDEAGGGSIRRKYRGRRLVRRANAALRAEQKTATARRRVKARQYLLMTIGSLRAAEGDHGQGGRSAQAGEGRRQFRELAKKNSEDPG